MQKTNAQGINQRDGTRTRTFILPIKLNHANEEKFSVEVREIARQCLVWQLLCSLHHWERLFCSTCTKLATSLWYSGSLLEKQTWYSYAALWEIEKTCDLKVVQCQRQRCLIWWPSKTNDHTPSPPSLPRPLHSRAHNYLKKCTLGETWETLIGWL